MVTLLECQPHVLFCQSLAPAAAERRELPAPGASLGYQKHTAQVGRHSSHLVMSVWDQPQAAASLWQALPPSPVEKGNGEVTGSQVLHLQTPPLWRWPRAPTAAYHSQQLAKQKCTSTALEARSSESRCP